MNCENKKKMTEKVVYMEKGKKEQRHNNHENNDRRVDAIPALFLILRNQMEPTSRKEIAIRN